MATMAAIAAVRLPQTIFNASLITRITSTWFAEQPRTAPVPTEGSVSLWFGMGKPAAERAAFDDSLRDAFGPALAALAPDRMPLPPFTSFAADRANALNLSAPFRALDVLSSADGDDEGKASSGLGLVLLLDQFPRNIFRSVEVQGAVFAHYDRLARALVYCMTLPSASMAAVDGGRGAGGLADIYGLHRSAPLARSLAHRMWFYLPLMHSEDLLDHDAFLDGLREFRAERGAEGDEEGTKYLDSQLEFEVQHRTILDRFGRYPHRNECQGRETTAEEKAYLDGGGETFKR